MLPDQSHDQVVIALAFESRLIEPRVGLFTQRDQLAPVRLPPAGLLPGIDGGLGERPMGGLADVEPFHCPASSGNRAVLIAEGSLGKFADLA